MGQCACFGGGAEQERRAEADRAESKEARAKAAEAAQRRQEEFDRSAAGRAAKAQMKAMKEAKTSSNQGEPVLKWQMGSLLMVDKKLVVTALDFWEDAAQSFSDV
uniref:Uncharacterized protein n=1 Tax=Oryza punctata TaxID=4537 RepID=A0A0E0MMV8_ORYPU